MKFLLILRDPVDRIHSDYRVSVRFHLLIMLCATYTPWGKCTQFCLFQGDQKILTGFYYGGLWEKMFLSINK